MKKYYILASFILLTLFMFTACEISQAQPDSKKTASQQEMINRGKYLVEIGGCNDCHSVGYAENGGQLAENDWLTGSPVGFRGPWGTTYASNLRLSVKNMNEDACVQMGLTLKGMPPMPWPSLNKMSEKDLRAIYQFISKLGPKGNPAPLLVGPDQEPKTPYIEFMPKHMERLSSK